MIYKNVGNRTENIDFGLLLSQEDHLIAILIINNIVVEV